MTTEPPATEGESASAPLAAEKPLKESLEDASVLLWYATREGKEISKEAISDIVFAQSSLGAGTRCAEVEGRFWGALRELAAAVKPASIDSILATYSYPFGQHGESGKRRLVDAAATKKKYSSAAVAVLILLLTVQIWWFIGTTIRADLANHRDELDHIAGSLHEMDLNAKDSLDLIKIKQQQINIAQSMIPITDSSGNDNVPSTINELTAELETLKKEQYRSELEYENATKRSFRVQQMLAGDTWMMNWWDFVTKLAGEPTKTTASPYVIMNPDDDKILAAIENVLFDNQFNVEMTLLNSKSTLAIFSQYVLPLLYGLLGALAYILRTLSNEIQSVTFTRGSEIRYSLRWPLGMLGGVTVGLFFDPAQFSGFAVVTPLGLAFLAGYGVELLFTGLDRLVSAFTGDNTARPKAT
jgi:hypothetical protein